MFSTPAGGPDVREAPACYDGEKAQQARVATPCEQNGAQPRAEDLLAPARGIGSGISLFSHYKASPTRKELKVMCSPISKPDASDSAR